VMIYFLLPSDFNYLVNKITNKISINMKKPLSAFPYKY
jgi:hypothetical protein